MVLSNSQSIDRTADFKAPIRAFVMDKFPACRQQGLSDDASLIESGIVDSMGILELVVLVESEFGVLVEDIDLTPENFESIAAISKFVAAKQRT